MFLYITDINFCIFLCFYIYNRHQFLYFLAFPAPDGIPPPVLKSPTPASVEIRWSEPVNPNGQLTGYSLERRVADTDNVELVASFPVTTELAYVDESASLSPHTSYAYRVRVTNTAGSGVGPWANVTTMSSREPSFWFSC